MWLVSEDNPEDASLNGKIKSKEMHLFTTRLPFLRIRRGLNSISLRSSVCKIFQRCITFCIYPYSFRSTSFLLSIPSLIRKKYQERKFKHSERWLLRCETLMKKSQSMQVFGRLGKHPTTKITSTCRGISFNFCSNCASSISKETTSSGAKRSPCTWPPVMTSCWTAFFWLALCKIFSSTVSLQINL